MAFTAADVGVKTGAAGFRAIGTYLDLLLHEGKRADQLWL